MDCMKRGQATISRRLEVQAWSGSVRNGALRICSTLNGLCLVAKSVQTLSPSRAGAVPTRFAGGARGQ